MAYSKNALNTINALVLSMSHQAKEGVTSGLMVHGLMALAHWSSLQSKGHARAPSAVDCTFVPHRSLRELSSVPGRRTAGSSGRSPSAAASALIKGKSQMDRQAFRAPSAGATATLNHPNSPHSVVVSRHGAARRRGGGESTRVQYVAVRLDQSTTKGSRCQLE